MNKISADPQSRSNSMPPMPGVPDGSASGLSDISMGDGPVYPLNQILQWADQLLESLDLLHNSNPAAVHGNIRPASFKIGENGAIKLVAAHSDGNASEADDFAYSPLEQIWEQLDPASQKVIINSFDDQAEADLLAPLDARSDLYSLAASLYHIMTGRKPADALERSIEFLDGNPDPLPRPDSLDHNISASVAEAIMTALNVKRGERHVSAAAMREALRSAGADSAAAPAPSVPAENPLLKKQQEIAAEQQRAAELEKRLREAEEQRIAAEKRAAEAERLLRVNEMASAPIEAAIPSSISDSPKAAEPLRPPSASSDFDSVLILEPDGGDATARYVDPEPIISMADPEPVAKSIDNDEVHYALAAEQPGGSKMMFVVAGGVAAILIAAAVAWFAFFAGKQAPAAAEVQQVPVGEQPAPVEPEPLQAVADEGATQEGATDPAVETAPAADASRTAAAARPAARTQDRGAGSPSETKTAVKPTPEKKKVTVDDLISDH